MFDFAIPFGVRLSNPDLAPALAAVGIEHHSYVANAVLNHSFTDRLRTRRLFIVESTCSKQPTEITGDVTLWLLVRETARHVCDAPALAVSTSTSNPPEVIAAAA